ncbi:MAG TPA: hypothetical protein VLI54_02955 [Bacillota bacterium]|nr:hypothetical protein [Bacillota bacterium]
MSDGKQYTKIVRTDDDGSKFEDATIDLVSQKIVEGVPPMRLGNLMSSAGALYLTSEKFDSEAHPAPRQQWVVIIRGVLEVEVSNGEKRRFGPGDLLFVADTTGKGHITTAIGDPPFEALFIPA